MGREMGHHENRSLRADEPSSTAVISPCATYRYMLTRRWDDVPTVVKGFHGTDLALWIMLNPSTADADTDDPTIRRCIAFSKAWGFAGLTVVNLFALRATNPEELRHHPDPTGPRNVEHIRSALADHHVCIAAWGASVEKAGSKGFATASDVRKIAQDLGRTLECLGMTMAGHPRHPLYVAASTSTQPYERASTRSSTSGGTA